MGLRFVHGIAVGAVVGLLAGMAGGGVATTALAGGLLDDEIDAEVAADQGAVTGPRTAILREPVEPPLPRDLQAYAGLGVWVDVFDFDPAYQTGRLPPVTPADVDAMADAGVTTIYLQAARLDDRTPTGLVSPVLLAQFLARAHAREVRVVGWYLPKFADVAADVERVRLLSEFESFGQRFDGVALDIEDRSTVPDHAQRSANLVEMSARIRQEVGDDPVGAIIIAPVQSEVVNDQFWPGFPYGELAPLYDAWLPMSYWSERSVESGYHDGYTYNEESVRRLRTNLGDDDAVVHSIGGIGDRVTLEELDGFVRSLVDTRSIGGSIYDWATLPVEHRQRMADAFATGPAAELPQPE
jgi:hypothetical protein